MFMNTRDGTAIDYSILGDPKAATKLALIHSLAMDRTFWRPVAERLADTAAVLIYDCRGHGQSDKPNEPYTVRSFADDLADLLDGAGWPSAIVGGASMGGSVALAFAQRYGRRVTGLGLFDTTAWYGPDAPKIWAERANKARAEGLAALVEFQKTRWFGESFRQNKPEIVQASIDTFLRNDPESYALTCDMLGACDLRAGLSAIKAPTRILVGEEDYATPVAMAQALHGAIAGSTLTVAKGARHLTPLEIPDQVAAELRALSR